MNGEERKLLEQEIIGGPYRIRRYLPSNLLRKLSEWAERLERRLVPRFYPRRDIRPLLDRDEVKIYFGCGKKRLPGWINVDKFPTLGADVVLDSAALNLASDSVDEIYSSHMIEHLPHDQFEQLLDEWYRVLKPGGKLTLRCPNFIWHVQQFLEAADYESRWARLEFIFGMSQFGPGLYHRNGFSAERLRRILTTHGFEVVQCEAVSPREGTPEPADLFCVAYKPSRPRGRLRRATAGGTEDGAGGKDRGKGDQSWDEYGSSASTVCP